jgi:hypothetical protein
VLSASAAPTTASDELPHRNLAAGQDELPAVKLPYVTHRALSYDPLRDVSGRTKVRNRRCVLML